MGFVSDWIEQSYVIGDDDSRLRLARRARAKAMPLNDAFALAADTRLPRRWYVAAAHDENRAADRLRGWGVDRFQAYLFGKPMPADYWREVLKPAGTPRSAEPRPAGQRGSRFLDWAH